MKTLKLQKGEGDLRDRIWKEMDAVRPDWRGLARYLGNNWGGPMKAWAAIKRDVVKEIARERRRNPSAWPGFDERQFDLIVTEAKQLYDGD